jgi:hypothetical protein
MVLGVLEWVEVEDLDLGQGWDRSYSCVIIV